MKLEPPSLHPKRILLAVTGLSPQIVTETLFALAQQGEDRFIPTEVQLITTTEGANRAKLALLSAKPGWFERLRHDYDLPPIRFGADDISIVRDQNGNPIADIRTPEDNMQCADFIAEKVRELTADPDTAVHVSIAGGRKTMGYFLGYALSLFGREQDRLSHVLVSEPFESSWNFFYPTPRSSIIKVKQDGQETLADAKDAVVTLADIPFIRMRTLLPKELLSGRSSYKETVDAARQTLSPPSIHINPVERTVVSGAHTFNLPPSELALLLLFAKRAKAGLPALTAPIKDAPDASWGQMYLTELRQIVGPMSDISSTESALRNGMDGDYFSQHLSKLNRQLKNHLGLWATPFLIKGKGRPNRSYALQLAAVDIHIQEAAQARRPTAA